MTLWISTLTDIVLPRANRSRRMIRQPSLLIPSVVAALVAVAAGAGEPGTNPVWQPISGGRWAPLPVASGGQPGFALLSPAQTGVAFTNTVSEEAAAANRVLLNGSGVAAGDFDSDGWPDLFFSSLNGRNTLFQESRRLAVRRRHRAIGIEARRTLLSRRGLRRCERRRLAGSAGLRARRRRGVLPERRHGQVHRRHRGRPHGQLVRQRRPSRWRTWTATARWICTSPTIAPTTFATVARWTCNW